MMRRRRKQKFTWMPMLGSRVVGGEADYGASWTRVQELVPNSDNSVAPNLTVGMTIFPLVPDFTQLQSDQVGEQFSLRDMTEGQDWLMKRVVGKVLLQASGPSAYAPDSWPQALVTVGVFVARSQDTAQADIDLAQPEYDPTNVDNVRNPWAYRKQWLLTDPHQTVSSGGFRGWNAPTSTMEYGSVADGPTIDIKVARRIRREERLWMVVSAVGFDRERTSVAGNQLVVDGLIDVRILGAMRRSSNKSTF